MAHKVCHLHCYYHFAVSFIVLLLDEECTAHVASAEEVEDSLIGKMQGK